jgi:hypothetical protein
MIHQIRAVNRKDITDIRNKFTASNAAAGKERDNFRRAGYKIIETLKHVVPKSKSDLIDLLNGIG